MKEAKQSADKGSLDGSGEETLEDQDFYEGFEGDDDVLNRGGHKKVAPVGATRPEKVTYATLPTGLKIGIVVALIVGVITGIWVAGSSSGSSSGGDPFASQAMPEGHPDISQMGGGQDAGLEATETGVGESIAALTALVEREPENLGARLDLGVAYFNTGDVEKAGELWGGVLAQDPENVGALYSMGFYYLSQEKPDTVAAEEMWQKVIDLDPESVEAVNAEAHIQQLSD